MEYIIKNKFPEKLFNFFEEISAIPRGSGNEKGIADYLEAFAKERNLEYKRDDADNLFIKIGGSIGRENEDAVLLQGHTDMVCEKNSDTEHDFEKDPLKLYIDENGWLRARGSESSRTRSRSRTSASAMMAPERSSQTSTSQCQRAR